MEMRFNETKATQAAAYLIKRREQGHMSYMKLMKLLYFAIGKRCCDGEARSPPTHFIQWIAARF